MAETQPSGESQPALSFAEKLASLTEPAAEGRAPLVSDKSLHRLVNLASQPRNQTPEGLADFLKKGDDWFADGKVPEGEWQILAGVLYSRAEELRGLETMATAGAVRTRDSVGGLADVLSRLTQGVEDTARATQKMAEATAMIEELPKEAEVQRRIILKILEEIESNDLPLTDYRNTLKAGILSHAIDRGIVESELAKECRARLALHHCASLAGNMPGKGENQIGYLFAVFESPESRKYALEAEDFDFLLEKGLPGLKVKDAFDLLQKSAREGLELEHGVVRFGAEHSSRTEQGVLRTEIINRIGLRDAKDAKKSFQLALRLAIATFETSIWNKDLLGNDPVAEAIYFKEYREGRAVYGRDRGPDITIPRIEGFGTSFFRTQQEVKLDRLTNAPRRLAALRKVNRERELKIDTINFLNFDPGAYQMFTGITLPRVLIIKNLLLKTTWKPEEFSSDAVESWVAPFRAADPEQVLRLRPEFVLGALWSIFSKPNEATNVGWDTFSLKAMENNLLHIYKGETKEAAFLNRDQFKWVRDTLKKYYRIDVDHQAAMVGVRMKLFQRVVGR